MQHGPVMLSCNVRVAYQPTSSSIIVILYTIGWNDERHVSENVTISNHEANGVLDWVQQQGSRAKKK